MLKLEVYFDGSCGPKNPGGTAAWGFVVKQDGETIHSKSGRVGKGQAMTNNVAEYAGLTAAMEYIKRNYPTAEVTFKGDSSLVISQMRGEAAVKKGKYVAYAEKALKIASPFIADKQWKFEWLQRAFNSEADDLAQYNRY